MVSWQRLFCPRRWRWCLLGLLISSASLFWLFFSYSFKSSASLVDQRFQKYLDRISLDDVRNLQKLQGIISDATRNPEAAKSENATSLNYNVHIFYYPWYANPTYDDGHYAHWNHEYLPHWDKRIAKNFPKGRHIPPDDVGASFYPQLGAYSNRNEQVLDQHMKWIADARVGVVVVSWYPSGITDQQGRPWDDLMPDLLDAADKYGIKVTFHIEPYTNRSAESVKSDLRYIVGRYGSHSAFYRHTSPSSLTLPLIYIYDSYLIPHADWQKMLVPKGPMSIRGTKVNAFVVGLALKSDDIYALETDGFDGVYTYFASDGFTEASTADRWRHLADLARTRHLLFVPSVGPGYDDTQLFWVRPWNYRNTKERRNGNYYREMVGKAIDSGAEFMSITSFNEWHEGTQLEPAVPKKNPVTQKYYKNYLPNAPNFYMVLTRSLVGKFSRR